MANMRITWPNRIGDATVYATPGIWTTQLPPSNLQTRQIAQVVRSVGLSNVHAYLDAGSAVKVEAFAAAGHNLSTAADVRLRGYTADPRGDYWWDLGPSEASQGIAITDLAYEGTYWGADGVLKHTAASGGIGISGTPRYTHAELDDSGECLGLLLEPARTNRVLHCRDGSNAAWTKSNCTALRTATGIDGAPNTATRMTATASTGRLSQSITLSATTRRYSVYLRRVSGTGTVSITVDNFGATTTTTLTSAWQRFDIAQTLSNPVIGVQLATSGDVIDVDFAQLEEGGYPTTPIVTTTAAVARTAYSVTLSVPASSSYTMLAVLRCLNAPTIGEYALVRGSTATGSGVYVTTGGNASSRGVNSSTAQWDLGSSAIVDTERVICWSATANDIACSVDGAAVTTDGTAIVGSATDISMPGSRSGTYVVKTIATWNAVSSDTDVEALAGTLARATADYDSGAVDAWPADWVSDTTAEQQAGVPGCAVVTGSSTAYRYWRVDLIDAANPDGYVQVGRLFGGSAWSPTINAEYGASLGYMDRDVVTEMDSGSEYMRKRPAPRVAQFALPGATDAEAIRTILDMQRRLGSTGEVLYEWDPDSDTYAPDRRFLARLQSVSPLQSIFLGRWGAEFVARELL